MRTRDENDLKRIKEEYGPETLKSLVKAAVGTGMVENASYNRGKPFFVSFRPVLHSTQRVTEKELESYNKYNEILDDLEYQLEQLKKEGLDIFDLTLELKLAKDKLKTGNFNMVDIYLDSVKPRIENEWKKLGKQPKHYQIKLAKEDVLADETELKRKEKKPLANVKKEQNPVATTREAIPKQQKLEEEETTKPQESDLMEQANSIISKMNQSIQQGNKSVTKQLYTQLAQLYKAMDKTQKTQLYTKIIELQKKMPK
jgi:hypothetical protein